jgi:hypothetical protein
MVLPRNCPVRRHHDQLGRIKGFPLTNLAIVDSNRDNKQIISIPSTPRNVHPCLAQPMIKNDAFPARGFASIGLATATSASASFCIASPRRRRRHSGGTVAGASSGSGGSSRLTLLLAHYDAFRRLLSCYSTRMLYGSCRMPCLSPEWHHERIRTGRRSQKTLEPQA